MIDRKLFALDRLLDSLLDTMAGNVNKWIEKVEIGPGHMPPFPRDDTRPRCVVKYGDSFLRYSLGPRQGYFWDCYGDDFQNPELALIAVLSAPVPPAALRPDVWSRDLVPAPTADTKERE
jgi:hypothetical protein